MLLQDVDARQYLARLLSGLLILRDQQDRVPGGIEGFAHRGKDFRADRTNNRHGETVGIEIAAEIAAHQGKGGRIPFFLPTVHYGA